MSTHKNTLLYTPGNEPRDTQPVVLRKPAVAQLGIKPNTPKMQIVCDAITKYSHLSLQEATSVAMQMLYNNCTVDPHPAYKLALRKIGLTVDPIESHRATCQLNFVEYADVPIIGAEAVHHYIKEHPNFLHVASPNECEYMFEALRDELKSEPVLFFCIMRTLNHYYNKDNADKLVKQLRSSSIADREKALAAMEQKSFYLTTMLPHSCSIANLLEEMSIQYKALQKHVAHQPIGSNAAAHPKDSNTDVQPNGSNTDVQPNGSNTAVQPEGIHADIQSEAINAGIPNGLLEAVPEVECMVPYHAFLPELKDFFTQYKDLLERFRFWRNKFDLNIHAFITDPVAPGELEDFIIKDDFRLQIREWVNKLQVRDANAIVDLSENFPILLRDYATLKEAFLATNILREKHKALCSMTPDPSNQEYKTAVQDLYTAVQAAQAEGNPYEEAVETFRKTLAETTLPAPSALSGK